MKRFLVRWTLGAFLGMLVACAIVVIFSPPIGFLGGMILGLVLSTLGAFTMILLDNE